jgi:choice-of-anchor C domain-containing protein
MTMHQIRSVLPVTLLAIVAIAGYSMGQERKHVAIAKPGSNLVVNGSFERRSDGEPNANIESLGLNDKVLLGWQVIESKRPSDGKRGEAPGFSNVDWIGPERWTASHGRYCLDLDGGVRQIVATKPGQRYMLEFDLAGNPEAGAMVQHVRVMLGAETHRFDFDSREKTKRKLSWITKRVAFTAQGDRTALVFVNAEPNVLSAGVALDNVVLQAVDDARPAKR